MNYAKHVKKQQRKHLKAQRKAANQRINSAYAVKQKSSGKFMMGIVVLIAYIANASEVHAFATNLF